MDISQLTYYPAYIGWIGEKQRIAGLPLATRRKKQIIGVYIIKENGLLVYVGKANQLKDKLYRHFQQWNDNRPGFLRERNPYDRVTYFSNIDNPDYSYKVAVVITETIEQAELLEKQLIIKYNPRDNKIKYKSFKESQNESSNYSKTDTWQPVNTGSASPF